MTEEKFKPAKVKAECRNCGPNRWANVVGQFSRTEDDDDSGIWGKTDYRILKCPACEEIFFQNDTIFEDYDVTEHPVTGNPQYNYSHTIEHWPPINKNRRLRPTWVDKLSLIDSHLFSLFASVYVALDNDINVLAAIDIRTVFDRASELLDVDAAKGFAEKLSDLLATGRIGAEEKTFLGVLTDAGSAAAHRGWKPTSEQLDTMMSIIESFMYRTFFLGVDAKKLRVKIPEKPKRKKKVASI